MSGDRLMNDSTLPKSASGRVAAGTEPRKKSGRFGLADWTRLLQSSKDLAQRHGQPLRKIRWEEIRLHNSIHDGWMVISGNVFFISPYMAYHPGGEAILKPALGKDATKLFQKYHPWVNVDGLIGQLHIGYLDTTRASDDDSDDEKPSYLLPQQISHGDFAMPAPRSKMG